MYLKEYINFHNRLKFIWLEMDQMSFHLTRIVNRKREWGLKYKSNVDKAWDELQWVHSLKNLAQVFEEEP